MNNFWQRTLAGAVFVAVVVSSCVYDYAQWVFGIFMLIAMDEWISIANGKEQKSLRLVAASFSASVYTIFILALKTAIIPIIILAVVVPFALQMFAKKGDIKKIAYPLAGYLYVLLPFLIAPSLNLAKLGEKNISSLLLLMILIWANDTFAYLSGKTFGRTKIFSTLSPKKTLEGYIGGIIFTLVFAYVFHLLYPFAVLWQVLVIASVVSVFANLGDLAESFVKRQFGIKDSGNIMPGHGGILDRFDSFLFAAPVYFYLITVFSLLG